MKTVSLFWQHHAPSEMDHVHLLIYLTALSKPEKMGGNTSLSKYNYYKNSTKIQLSNCRKTLIP